MTLAYNLFGIPQTLEEMVHKFKKKQKEHVDIILREYYIGLGNFDHYEIKAESGKIKVRIGRFFGYAGIFGMNRLKPVARQGAFTIAIHQGKEMEKKGLEITIKEEEWKNEEKSFKEYSIRKAEEELKKQEKFNETYYSMLKRLLQPD